MSESEFQFDATVSAHDFGRMAYTVLYAPPAVVSALSLSENPRLRITGYVADQPYKGAFQPAGDDKYYLILSKNFLKTAQLEVGDSTTARFIVADQDAVDVPPELDAALHSNSAVAAVWNSLTPGKRRGLAHRVSSAKREETRAARVEEVLEELEEFK